MKRIASLLSISIFVFVLFFTPHSIQADESIELSDSLVEYLRLAHKIEKPITQDKLNEVENLSTTFFYESNQSDFDDVSILKVHTITDFTGIEKLVNLNEIVLSIDTDGSIPLIDLNEIKKLDSVSFILKMPDFDYDLSFDEGIIIIDKISNELVHNREKSEIVKNTIVRTLNSIRKETATRQPLYIELIDLPFYDLEFLTQLKAETYLPYVRPWTWHVEKVNRPKIETIRTEEGLSYRMELKNPNYLIYSDNEGPFEVDSEQQYVSSFININPTRTSWMNPYIGDISYENLAGEIVEFEDAGPIQFKRLFIELNQIDLPEGESIDKILSIESQSTKPIFAGNRDLESTIFDEYYVSFGGDMIKYTVSFETNSDTILNSINNIERYTHIDKPQSFNKDGFTFKGWYRDPDFKERWDFTNDVVENDTTLYASWEELALPGADGGEKTKPEDTTKVAQPIGLNKVILNEGASLPQTGISTRYSLLPLALILIGSVGLLLSFNKRFIK